uniref:2,3-bisphosphoglycerate-independent phosphoglycerate mutase n=1 Tax=Polysiphonia scopulorum TaxID=257860 RepID=A0A1Z1MHI2_9FLOR|nr:phosphoglycerate mutase [Polysiphonia scopulorum]ARW65537.1 phosphoglycerate mutase [Polysiphonia scopulorum]
MYHKNIHPIILTILDGWGYSESTKGNAIRLANTPNMDKIWQKYPKCLLSASGEDVGLPKNQMGNSEVGHTTIGSGRIINQDLVRIHKSIETGEFERNTTIHNLCQKIIVRKTKLHVIGLCSDGGVHSHIEHLKSIIRIVNSYSKDLKVCLHLITDGRDTEAKIATQFLDTINKEIEKNENINISTISGRYYSMDRDCRWSRTEKVYNILTDNEKFEYKDNYADIINAFYNNDISDEFIPPTRINDGSINDYDGIIFFNFRPDRIRQLVQCFAKTNFKGFPTKEIKGLLINTLTEYDSSLKFPVIFSPPNHKNFLGEIISQCNLKQLRLAETEKYAHVTYFFNGGIEEPFPGEDRELIPSPKVDTYDLQPAMSAYELTDSTINAINRKIYTLIVINYANPDMVGHTGKLNSTIEAVEVVDKCIGRLLKKVEEIEGTLIITADHGNADYMLDLKNKPCKSHSTNLVPFIAVDHQLNQLKTQGTLADIAPTILEMLNIQVPEEMNGESLIKNNTRQKLN